MSKTPLGVMISRLKQVEASKPQLVYGRFEPVTCFASDLTGATRLVHKALKYIGGKHGHFVPLNADIVQDIISEAYHEIMSNPDLSGNWATSGNQRYFGIETTSEIAQVKNLCERFLTPKGTKREKRLDPTFNFAGVARRPGGFTEASYDAFRESDEREFFGRLKAFFGEKNADLYLTLKAWDMGYKSHQIANALGISDRAVNKRLSKAKVMLAIAFDIKG